MNCEASTEATSNTVVRREGTLPGDDARRAPGGLSIFLLLLLLLLLWFGPSLPEQSVLQYRFLIVDLFHKAEALRARTGTCSVPWSLSARAATRT